MGSKSPPPHTLGSSPALGTSWPGDGSCELSSFWSSFVLPGVGIRGGGVSSCSPGAQSISVAWGAQISLWVEGILIGNLSTWLIFGVSKAQRISHSVLKGACSKRASRRMELFGSWGWKCLGKGVPKGECSFLGEHAGLGPSPPSVDQEERGVDYGGSLFRTKCCGKTPSIWWAPFLWLPISARSFGSL